MVTKVFRNSEHSYVQIVLSKILVVTLSLLVSQIANDGNLLVGILFYYVLGCFLRRVLLNENRDNISVLLFDFFFCIYVLLVVFSHQLLIKDPYEDFYFHNDAAWSFYRELMEFVLPCKWSELTDKTLLSPYFAHFPLAMYLWGAIGKIGMALEITDLRLFLRFQGCVFSALIISMTCNLLKSKNVPSSVILKSGVILGFFSYVFIASAVFTRDLLVMFAYTYISYCYLYPQCSCRIFKMLIGVLLALGFRPENGYIAVLFIFAYYYPIIKRKMGVVWILIPVIAIIAAYPLVQYMFNSMDELFSYYNDYIRSDAASDGFFMKVYSLPFPFNQLILWFYVVVQPLPFLGYMIGKGMTILNFPSIVMPFLNVWVFSITLFYLFFAKIKDECYIILILVLVGIYTIVMVGSPDMRRSFAIFPSLFVISILVREKVQHRKIIWYFFFPVLLFLNCAFSIYVYI